MKSILKNKGKKVYALSSPYLSIRLNLPSGRSLVFFPRRPPHRSSVKKYIDIRCTSKYLHTCRYIQIYLNTVSDSPATDCSSSLTGHFNQKLSSSSVYPMIKYILLGGCIPMAFLLKRKAILTKLCCLLMMTSESIAWGNVPPMNFRMNMSSINIL